MKLFHYSHEPNLDVVDPAHYGKNKSISPEYRQGTKHLVPRSYFYAERDEPEGVVAAGRHRYETELPQDFKTYDLRQDPEGIRSHVHKQTGLVGPGLSDEMEHEIARRGYHGYRPTDNVLISFKPIPVKKPNLLANERSFMSKNLKEKAFDALKKAAEYFITNPEALTKAEAPEKVDRVETPNKESEIFQETAAGIKNAPKEELKQPAPMKKDEAGKKADLVSVPTGSAAPAAPKVSVPPKGSQIALKGRIKPESINKLKEAGYHPYFADDKPKRPMLKEEIQKAVHAPRKDWDLKGGTSDMGLMARTANKLSANNPAKEVMVSGAKEEARKKLEQSKAQPKPNLPKAELNKDDKPHPPGSPQDSAHDVVEEHSSIQKELQALSPEERQQMLQHLRTLKERINLRSDKNRKIGQD